MPACDHDVQWMYSQSKQASLLSWIALGNVEIVICNNLLIKPHIVCALGYSSTPYTLPKDAVVNSQ